MTGIYMITFGSDENAHFYIGQSVNIKKRKREHLNKLRDGKHKNAYMQNMFDKYGEESMTFEVLCECAKEKLNEFEEYYIFTMQTFVNENPHGLNLNTGGGGYNHSDETRAKIGKANKGRTPSDEARAKMSKAQKGRTISDKTRAKISKALKGKISAETRAKISKANKGRKHSEETKQKMREANKERSKPVLCVELGKTFSSMREANRFVKETFGITINVRNVLTGRAKIAGGFHWEYYSLPEEAMKEVTV